MRAQPLSFPEGLPPEITRTLDEPQFDARRHLALEMPERSWTLEEFGYDAEARARTPSPLAITTPFRVLSEEGTNALHAILTELKADRHVSSGRRLSIFLTGGVYRSRFLRDLVAAPELVEHFSRVAGTELLPHSLPHFRAYVNYTPDDPAQMVDNWHVDSLAFDAVMMLSDPSRLKGGYFQYFEGTREEAKTLVGADSDLALTHGWTQDLPAERVVSAAFPAAGYAVFMQGDYIFHRAAKLDEPGERITLVPGYVARDLRYPDRTNTGWMQGWRDSWLMTEVTRHAAWLGREKLAQLIEEVTFADGADRLAIAERLEAAVADVLKVAREMREGAAAAAAELERKTG